jgi:hypothetical protein
MLQGCLHAALRYSSCVYPALLPSAATHGPSPMQLRRLPPMRLELTMFMLSLSSTISEVCLTVQKPTVRTYCIGETLPHYSNLTCASAFIRSTHALRRTDITRSERPAASSFSHHQPLHYTPVALDCIVPYLVLCAVYQKTPSPSPILSTCTGTRTSPLLP